MRWLVISGLVMLFGCLPKTTFKPIDKVNPFIQEETNNRVSISKVEFREHNKNNAIYVP